MFYFSYPDSDLPEVSCFEQPVEIPAEGSEVSSALTERADHYLDEETPWFPPRVGYGN